MPLNRLLRITGPRTVSAIIQPILISL
jgi:hypothetical protein